METIRQLLEIAMIACFGFSWPNNIRTTLKNRSAKGKSPAFLLLIDTGYLCGIFSKPLSGEIFCIYAAYREMRAYFSFNNWTISAYLSRLSMISPA